MYIKNLKLKNFRNYEELNIDFNDNVNIFLGKNAQGKTNILESLYLTSIGRSFRTSRITELIEFKKEYSKVRAEYAREDYEGSVSVLINSKGEKNIEVDGIRIKKASEILDNILIVIFSPEDLKIVKDEPEKRRRFIDKELCQINPYYLDCLSNYKKSLIQRNYYLKENKVDENILNVWDEEIIKYGSEIIRIRKEFIEELKKISREIHKKITNKNEILDIIYNPNIKTCENKDKQKEEFRKCIVNSRENDIRYKTTTRGPHKDDLDFFINEINVRSFGSQGQQRTAALSLKLAEIEIIKKEKNENPILLLDDVMSELDKGRQEFLIKTLENVQLFITTTEMDKEILDKFPEGKIFYVNQGKISN